MYTHLFPSSPQIVVFLSLSISIAVSTCYAVSEEEYRRCGDELYSCGDVGGGLRYPFFGGDRPEYCGLKQFNLTCKDDEYPIISIDNNPFRVHQVNQITHMMNLSRLFSEDDFCKVQDPSNATLSVTRFQYGPDVKLLYLYYDCDPVNDIELARTFGCEFQGRNRSGFFSDSSIEPVSGSRCTSIRVRVTTASFIGLVNGFLGLKEALDRGFEVNYNWYAQNCSRCEASKGICGSDSSGLVCTRPRKRSRLPLKLGIGFGAGGFTFLVMAILFYFYHRRAKRRYSTPSWVSRSMSSYPSSVKDLEKTGACIGVQIFHYEELEKATNYFDSKRILGDGGYGTVYQGKLKDGRDIAVKRLYEHNYNRVAQFMNEVQILTRLRHQNLVSLYGFTSRHCRELLLVYEFIPNGTVADHLHGEIADSRPLSWATRMSIAVETASALVYLHASDIIHRDVKTNNILLDNNFGVKVADFGLSRLVPNDVTHVSTAPQGTPGYVDPDYHESYQLTDKSDVFSFGVVLIELISSKPAVDMARHRQEINLSNMAINKIQNRVLHELVDPSLGFQSDEKVRTTVSDVAELAFRCLQSGKDMRPTMLEVLETLERIQADGSDEKIADVPKESVIAPSPDSVTIPWISTKSTPNTSC